MVNLVFGPEWMIDPWHVSIGNLVSLHEWKEWITCDLAFSEFTSNYRKNYGKEAIDQ